MGSWATDNINKLSSLELKNYEKILNKDTTEIYDLLINRKNDKEVDDTIKNIIAHVDNNLLCSSPKKYENIRQNAIDTWKNSKIYKNDLIYAFNEISLFENKANLQRYSK